MTTKEVAEEIIKALSDRKGFDGWYGNIDDDTKKEIIDEMSQIIDGK